MSAPGSGPAAASATPRRCAWATSALGIAYHDAEWGVPHHDDRALFELLILEGAQAGLSWETILRKRARYREVFDQFEMARVARFGPEKVAALLADPGIVRNRQKIAAAIQNAQACLGLVAEHGSFAAYLWAFVGGAPRTNHWRTLADLPAHTPKSDALSRDLRRRGFAFVGSTICYAFMQAAGLVNDHTVDCFRYAELVQPAGA